MRQRPFEACRITLGWRWNWIDGRGRRRLSHHGGEGLKQGPRQVVLKAVGRGGGTAFSGIVGQPPEEGRR